MHRRTSLIVALLVMAAPALLVASDKAVVGTWQVLSDSPGGEQYQWTLVVKDEEGKLSGTLTGGPGQFTLLEPKAESDTFTCKIAIEGETYLIQVNVAGTKFEGTWKGPGSQGTLKGTKRS